MLAGWISNLILQIASHWDVRRPHSLQKGWIGKGKPTGDVNFNDLQNGEVKRSRLESSDMWMFPKIIVPQNG